MKASFDTSNQTLKDATRMRGVGAIVSELYHPLRQLPYDQLRVKLINQAGAKGVGALKILAIITANVAHTGVKGREFGECI